MAAGMPHWSAVQRARSAIGEHPPATPSPIVVHALGIVELCLGALEPTAEEKRGAVGADERNRNHFASSPTLAAAGIAVRTARQTGIRAPDVRVWESSGCVEIQRPITSGGTDASKNGRLILARGNPDDASIAAHGAEVSSCDPY